MKIYTKTGDGGDTGLFGGGRVSKAHLRVDTYGEVDELNSTLGLVRTEPLGEELDGVLAAVQSRLFDLGAELATSQDSKAELGIPLVSDLDIESLERTIDRAEAELSPLRTFVLPGGSKAAAYLHISRTICRRAERRLVALGEREAVRAECIRYLNRLSDMLFVLARLVNSRAGVPDVPWSGARGARNS